MVNILLSALSGILGGVIATPFLYSSNWADTTRESYSFIIYLLPISGLIIGGLWDFIGKNLSGGPSLVIQEIHKPEKTIPLKSIPLLFITSVVSLLFGASVGREGAIVQMSASLTDQLSQLLFHLRKLTHQDRILLLMAGSAAGFSAALGAPLAGALFGMEVLTPHIRFKVFNLFECLVAAGVAYGVTQLLNAPHVNFGTVDAIPFFSLHHGVAAIIMGALTGIFIRTFIMTSEFLTGWGTLQFESSAARAFFAGCSFLLCFILFENSGATGLGVSEIKSSFLVSPSPAIAFQKLILTVISIAGGFKGGEFIPVIFMGATLSSSIAGLLTVAPGFAAACGLVSSFGSGGRVPLTMILFAGEFFGISFIPYASLACLMSFLVMGKNKTLYKSQHLGSTS